MFITKDDVVKLGDFGFCIDQTMERPVTRLGTLISMSPEVLRAGRVPKGQPLRTYGAEIDVWALGVMVFEMLTLKCP